MRTSLFLSLVIGVSMSTALGCAGRTDAASGSTTLHGTLSNPQSLDLGSDMRIAVVWTNGSTGQHVSEDLPAQFSGSDFAVQLPASPRDDVIFTPQGGPAGVRVAVGSLVAYEDRNGDGQLDLVPSDAGAFIDEVVGVNGASYLAYIEGTLPASGPPADSSGKMPSLGYDIYTMADACGPGPSADGGAPCDTSQWLGLDHDYLLLATVDPDAGAVMCENYGESASSGGSGTAWDVGTQGTPPGGYPQPTASGLVCIGATEYTLESCTTTGPICQRTRTCEVTTVTLGGASPPAGWPCP